MGDDSPPDNCTCGWSMNPRQTTDHPFGRMVRVTTNSDCAVHGSTSDDD